jgi:hypothetical protein
MRRVMRDALVIFMHSPGASLVLELSRSDTFPKPINRMGRNQLGIPRRLEGIPPDPLVGLS